MPDRGSAASAAAARTGAARWADLRVRVLSALVLLPVGLGCLWLGGWAWIGLVGAASLGLALEFLALCGAREAGVTRLIVPAAAIGAALFAAFGLAWAGLALLAAASLLVWLVSRRIAPALGVPYVGLTAIALIWLRGGGEAGWGRVLFVLLAVWATDISAYVIGRVIGGPRLAPAISPGKTWSGAAGGLVGALVVGWSVAALHGGGSVLLAGLLSVIAQSGDLMESWLKRRYGVKDSGRLIPGHGGLLDRLDGVMTAAPAAALLAMIAGSGTGFGP